MKVEIPAVCGTIGFVNAWDVLKRKAQSTTGEAGVGNSTSTSRHLGYVAVERNPLHPWHPQRDHRRRAQDLEDFLPSLRQTPHERSIAPLSDFPSSGRGSLRCQLPLPSSVNT